MFRSLHALTRASSSSSSSASASSSSLRSTLTTTSMHTSTFTCTPISILSCTRSFATHQGATENNNKPRHPKPIPPPTPAHAASRAPSSSSHLRSLSRSHGFAPSISPADVPRISLTDITPPTDPTNYDFDPDKDYNKRKAQFQEQVRAVRRRYREEYQERFRIQQTKAETQAKRIKDAARARLYAHEESSRVVHLREQMYILKRKQKQKAVAIQKYHNRVAFEARRRTQREYQLAYLRWERTQYWIRDIDQDLHAGIFDQELVLPGFWPSKPVPTKSTINAFGIAARPFTPTNIHITPQTPQPQTQA